jgi:hypothetical protein
MHRHNGDKCPFMLIEDSMTTITITLQILNFNFEFEFVLNLVEFGILDKY